STSIAGLRVASAFSGTHYLIAACYCSQVELIVQWCRVTTLVYIDTVSSKDMLHQQAQSALK
ncbi:MAG: hypothetical protein JSU70_06325, partial [Phycisphaerales bacterium]